MATVAESLAHYQKIAHSTGRDDWFTPRLFVSAVEKRYDRPFDLDVAATQHTRVCPAYLGPDHIVPARRDALRVRWRGFCWCNPPYGRDVTWRWVQAAWHQAWRGFASTVILIPNRIGSDWFYRYGLRADELVILVGRLKFDDGEDSAPFDSVLLVYHAREQLAGGEIPEWDRYALPKLSTMHVPPGARWRD